MQYCLFHLTQPKFDHIFLPIFAKVLEISQLYIGKILS